MKAHRSLLLFVFALLAVAMLAWACGDNGEEATPTQPAQETPQPTATAPETPPEPVTLKMGLVGRLSGYWPLWAAMEEGFFDDEAITIDLTFIDTDARLTSALIGGSVDLIANTVFIANAANQQGADLRLFCGLQNLPYYRFFTQPDVTSLEDLEGKTLAVSEADTGADAFVIQEWLRPLGLEKDTNYEMTNAGGLANRLAALSSGAVDGTILVPPFDLQAIEAGFTQLGASPDAVPHFQWSAFIAKESWLQENSDTAVRFCRAIVNAAKFVQDPANADASKAALMTATELSQEDADLLYDLLVPALTPDGSLDPEGFAPWAKYMDVSEDEAKALLDDTYLQEAQATAD